MTDDLRSNDPENPNPTPSTALMVLPVGQLRHMSGRGDKTLTLALVGAWAGPNAADETLEFLTADISNPNTRRAYNRAIGEFVAWCGTKRIPLPHLCAADVATHIGELGARLQPLSVKLHLAALKHWMDKLVVRHVLPYNPAHAVRGPRYSQSVGKAPVLEVNEAKRLFECIKASDVCGARDRALIAVLLYSFARIDAVLKMRLRDYRGVGTENATFVLHEKGGKLHRIAAHHQACEYLNAYIALAGLADPDALLWQGTRQNKLTGTRLAQSNACRMIKRHCRAANLPDEFGNHSFRATGLTVYFERGGDLETARQMAGHASVKTTQIYIRARERRTRAEVERVQL